MMQLFLQNLFSTLFLFTLCIGVVHVNAAVKYKSSAKSIPIHPTQSDTRDQFSHLNVINNTLQTTNRKNLILQTNSENDDNSYFKVWGENMKHGFFGDGTLEFKSGINTAFRNSIGNSRRFSMITLSQLEAIAVTEDGKIFKSGTSTAFLAEQQWEFTSSWDPTGNYEIYDICSGYEHTIMLLKNGFILGRGSNKRGQLGGVVLRSPVDNFSNIGANWWGMRVGDSLDSYYSPSNPIRFSFIDAHADYTLTSDGISVWTLGDCVLYQSDFPHDVGYNSTIHGQIIDMTAAVSFFLIINENGVVFHTGVKVGQPTGVNLVPTIMTFPEKIDIAQCGETHCLALNGENSQLWAFGSIQGTGSLGDPAETKETFEPVEVINPSSDPIEIICASSGYSSFATITGEVYVWDSSGAPVMLSSKPKLYSTSTVGPLLFVDKETVAGGYFYYGIANFTSHLVSMGVVSNGQLGTGKMKDSKPDFTPVEAVFIDNDVEMLEIVQNGGFAPSCTQLLGLSRKYQLFAWGCGNPVPRQLDTLIFVGREEFGAYRPRIYQIHQSSHHALISTIDDEIFIVQDDLSFLQIIPQKKLERILDIVTSSKNIWVATENELFGIEINSNYTLNNNELKPDDKIISLGTSNYNMDDEDVSMYALSHKNVIYMWEELGPTVHVVNSSIIPASDVLFKLTYGTNHIIVLGVNGQPYAMGDNSFGQLGVGNLGSVNYFVPVDISQIPMSEGLIVNVYSIGTESYALTEKGSIYVWGRGAATTANIIPVSPIIPSPIPSLSNEKFGKLSVVGGLYSYFESTTFAYNMFSCGSYIAGDYRVCSKHGICIGQDKCNCETGYGGSTCEQYYCYNILENEANVCSGNGKCVGYNRCECDPNYSDFDCRHRNTPPFWLILLPVIFVICCLLSCIAAVSLFSILALRRMKRKQALTAQHLHLLQNKFEMEEMLDADANKARMQLSSDMFEIKFSDIKLLKRIAVGGSGAVVWKSTWKGDYVALKIFKTSFLTGSTFFAEFEHEVQLLGSLQNPNIVRFFGACLDHPRIGLVMEWCEQGSLVDMIQNGKMAELQFREKLKLISQIAHGIHFLHSKNIIHRDLKCDNVLIDEYGVAKIADFGLSKVSGADEESRLTSHVGTSYYISPEVLSGKYDAKCDVYSFGIIIFEILTDELEPFKDLFGGMRVGIENLIAQNPYKRPSLTKMKIPGEGNFLFGLVERCWKHIPEERPDMEEIVTILDNAILPRTV